MKIHEILNERVSSVLYHVIDFPGAVRALKTNTLKSIAPKGVVHNLSFTRSLTGQYHIEYKLIGVIFEVDGDKLNRKYKGAPVGTEEFETDDDVNYHGRDNKQYEDRLASTKQGLSDFDSYIKSAIIFIPNEFVNEDDEDGFGGLYSEQIKSLPTVLKLLKQKKIPFRFVASVKDLYNKKTNDESGVLDIVLRLDKNVAGKLGVDITVDYEVYLTMAEKLPDDEIDEYTGSDISYISVDPIEVNTTSPEEAYKIAKKDVDAYNKGKDENLKKAGDSYLFIDEIRGAGKLYEINNDGSINHPD